MLQTISIIHVTQIILHQKQSSNQIKRPNQIINHHITIMITYNNYYQLSDNNYYQSIQINTLIIKLSKN
jgi:hypothetical protein